MKLPNGSLIQSSNQIFNYPSSQNLNNEEKIVMKKLTDYLPLSLNEGLQQFHSLDEENVYFFFKDYLYVQESQCTIIPREMLNCYSNFGKNVGTLNFIKSMEYSIKSEKQILMFNNEKGSSFVLKRFSIKFNFTQEKNDEELAKLNKVEKFIEEMYKENHLVKIYNGNIHSTNHIGFNIIHLPKIKFLVTELLMEYAGVPLKEAIPIDNPSTLIFYFKQMAEILNYLEIFRIAHNDLKQDNFIIDKLPHFNLIRLIDFDIGTYEMNNLTYKTHKIYRLKGFTPGYASPEIINSTKKNFHVFENLNLWKCQTYSLGVVILEIICFFSSSNMSFDDFDHYKESEKEYEIFTKIFLDFYNSQKNIYLQNVLKIVQFCL